MDMNKLFADFSAAHDDVEEKKKVLDTAQAARDKAAGDYEVSWRAADAIKQQLSNALNLSLPSADTTQSSDRVRVS
jgi:hypothetical protein